MAPRYHFSLYLPDVRDSYFNALIAGAERAAQDYDAALSIHSISPAKNEFEMASYTGVSGVIVCPYLDDDAARKGLERLTARRIPLVLINHNVPHGQPWPYIGANNFETGKKIGELARGGGNANLRLAIVYSDKSPGIYAERELVEMGVTAAAGNRLSAPILGLKTGQSPLDAESLVLDLFHSRPDVNTLVFTDANDSLAAAQTLIDMNLVGRVRVIGFGNDKPLLEYVKKGVMAGSVVVYPERIGSEAVRSLWNLCESGYTSTNVDTGVETIQGSAK
jgi:ribose transport system substrate-binding protein